MTMANCLNANNDILKLMIHKTYGIIEGISDGMNRDFDVGFKVGTP